jgi:glycosyltransferase involved in cell wall biosynthesis
LWPVEAAPHAGRPIYETALRLREWAEVEVFCPAARYPALGWLQPRRHVYHRVAGEAGPAGLTTQYLEYWTLPGVGRWWNGMATERALEPALRAWRPDVVLCYWLYPTAWAAVRVGRGLSVPVVVGARGSDLHRIPDGWVRRMTATTVRRAAAVLTVTEELRGRALELGASAGRTHTITNGCDRTIYQPGGREEARRRLGLEEAGRLVLQVGHLIPSKGVFDLWEAFAGLAGADAGLRLALVGEGPAAARLGELAEGAGLGGRLLLPGARPAREVADWMAAADVVALASHGEGCPNVVVEALACGRPVVGCAVGGVPELVRPDCGLLVPARRPDELGRALGVALGRDWDAAGIAQSYQRGWDDVARETYAVCQNALAGG